MAERIHGIEPGKQPSAREHLALALGHSPPSTQTLEHHRREHRVAILQPFTPIHTRHAEVARFKNVLAKIAALTSLAGGIGDRMVRNMGTLGGSLAHNDPVADYPAAVLGLNATVNTNKRKIAADDFFQGMFETALQTGEIIVSVSFPVPKRAAYIKFKNPTSRYAIVGVLAAETGNGVRVAVTGAASSVFRVPEMEKALAAKWSPDSVAGISVPAGTLNSDLHASAEYRSHLITVMARRAVEAAK